MEYGKVASIITIAFFIMLIIFLLRLGKKETVRKIILSLVVKAEKRLGSGTGGLKYAMVVEELYGVLPAVVRMLFTQSDIDEMIESGVKTLKEYLETGRTLSGYDDEVYINKLGDK